MVHFVEVIIGHTSTMLPPSERKDNHTHRWTLFVIPANRDYEDFPDNKLIQKVRFQLHDTFPEPERLVQKPPFRITETGFAGFTAFVTIQLNIPNEKPRTIEYELDLLQGYDNANEKLQKLAIRADDLKPEHIELIKMYAGSKRRKASMVSSSNDEKSPHEKPRDKDREKRYEQKRLLTPIREDVERDVDREKRKKSKKEGSSEREDGKKEKQRAEYREKEHRDREHREKEHREKDQREKRNREKEHREKKSQDKETKNPERAKSPEELTKKLNECEDPRVIYRAGQYLLEHLPDTQLDIKNQNLTYDLTKGSTKDLLEIERILKKATKQNS